MAILILGLGNDLLSDDRIGLLAARALRALLQGQEGIEIVESAGSGLALLDLMAGYERAIVIDAIQTGQVPPGTILEWRVREPLPVRAPSPHFTGLPELLAVAQALQIPFPEEIHIYAVEVTDPYTLGREITPAVRRALPELMRRIQAQLQAWQVSPEGA
ncbi:MAG: hydrogenase maturation protease [Thermoflexus sp.]|jgi:hydrogenase maturation protease|nr:hydrogenase maturation protease [Thermoflexus sp.]